MRQGAGNAISINGSRPTSNNYMLDGTSNTDTALGTPAAILSIDAIQEFKEQTATYSAEYGFSANQISIVSKTGTNRLSGSVFSFMRNDALDAKRFFDVEKQKLDQKQYGFVVGGPVLLPGYNGRNKTFFLVNYEGMRREVGSQDFLRVPLARRARRAVHDDDHRSGDGSAVRQQHDSVRAALRGWRISRSPRTTGRRRMPASRRGTTSGSGTCRPTRTSSPCASTSSSDRAGARYSGATRRRTGPTSRWARSPSSATCSSSRRRGTGRCRIPCRSRPTSSTSSGSAMSGPAPTSTAPPRRKPISTPWG